MKIESKKSCYCKNKFLPHFLSSSPQIVFLLYAKSIFAPPKLSPKLNLKCLTNKRPRISLFSFYKMPKTILHRNVTLLADSNGKIATGQLFENSNQT